MSIFCMQWVCSIIWCFLLNCNVLPKPTYVDIKAMNCSNSNMEKIKQCISDQTRAWVSRAFDILIQHMGSSEWPSVFLLAFQHQRNLSHNDLTWEILYGISLESVLLCKYLICNTTTTYTQPSSFLNIISVFIKCGMLYRRKAAILCTTTWTQTKRYRS